MLRYIFQLNWPFVCFIVKWICLCRNSDTPVINEQWDTHFWFHKTKPSTILSNITSLLLTVCLSEKNNHISSQHDALILDNVQNFGFLFFKNWFSVIHYLQHKPTLIIKSCEWFVVLRPMHNSISNSLKSHLNFSFKLITNYLVIFTENWNVSFTFVYSCNTKINLDLSVYHSSGLQCVISFHFFSSQFLRYFALFQLFNAVDSTFWPKTSHKWIGISIFQKIVK